MEYITILPIRATGGPEGDLLLLRLNDAEWAGARGKHLSSLKDVFLPCSADCTIIARQRIDGL
jgi:hypothetical protein